MSLTKDIQATVCRAELLKGNLVAENISYFFAGELDVIAVNKSGYVCEFEVKISRADFRADARKNKWSLYDKPYNGDSFRYTPNYFAYVCPDGLIQLDELKPYMGLVYFMQDGALNVIRKPKLIHRHKHNLERLLRKMCSVNNWKASFGAQRLTIMNRAVKDRNDPAEARKFIETMRYVNENHRMADVNAR